MYWFYNDVYDFVPFTNYTFQVQMSVKLDTYLDKKLLFQT